MSSSNLQKVEGSDHGKTTAKDELSTDYIIKLLENDAKKIRKKFDGNNTESETREATGIRPNTTFLKSLIQQSTSHNKALLRKEQDKAKQKLDEKEIESRLERSRDLRSSSGYTSASSQLHVSRGHDHGLRRDRSKSPFRKDPRHRSKSQEEKKPKRRYDSDHSESSPDENRISNRDEQPKRKSRRSRHEDNDVKRSHPRRDRLRLTYNDDPDEIKVNRTHTDKLRRRDHREQKGFATKDFEAVNVDAGISRGRAAAKERIFTKGRGFRANDHSDERRTQDDSAFGVSVAREEDSDSREKLLKEINSRLRWKSSNTAVERKPDALQKPPDSEIREFYRKQEEVDWSDFTKKGETREWDKSKVVDGKGYIRHVEKWK